MPDPSTARPAAISFGNFPPVLLCGIPRAEPVTAPGTVAITLGVTPEGQAVGLASMSLEWLDDLESAVQAARAAAVVEAGMAQAVTR